MILTFFARRRSPGRHASDRCRVIPYSFISPSPTQRTRRIVEFGYSLIRSVDTEYPSHTHRIRTSPCFAIDVKPPERSATSEWASFSKPPASRPPPTMTDAPLRKEEPRRDDTRPRSTREDLLHGDRDSASEEKFENRAGGAREAESDRPGRSSDSRRPPLYKLLTPYGGS